MLDNFFLIHLVAYLLNFQMSYEIFKSMEKINGAW